MKKIRLVTVNVATAFLLLTAFPLSLAQPGEAGKVLQTIQGKWILVRVFLADEEGKLIEEKPDPQDPAVLIVHFVGKLGIKYQTRYGRTERAPTAFLVDPNSDPIGCDDVSYSKGGKIGNVLRPGIMKLENGRLIIALNPNANVRPKAFDPKLDKNCGGLAIFEPLDAPEKK